MSADTAITADAITNGDGGKVILWSDESTRAYGSISTRGGALGGNGGLIETSGHWLDVADIRINASAPSGSRGLWLLDPADVTISVAANSNEVLAGGVFSPTTGAISSNINSVALGNALSGVAGTDITISTTSSGNAPGNITVVDPITWVRTGFTNTTLTLNASGDVNINAAITATKGNLVACCGHDVNVNAAITMTNGSVLLNAGHDVNITRSAGANAGAAITVTDGNIELCAGHDVILNNLLDAAPMMTLTNGSTTAGESLSNLGVPLGLTLRAGNAATGPGAAGGTVTFVNGEKAPAGTYITVTAGGAGTPVSIYYNPINYSTPTPYSLDFTGTGGPVTSYMLVYPDGADKTYDGTNTATFTGLKGSPAGVTLNPGGTANFATADAGVNKIVTFKDFILTQVVAITPGDAAINFALPANCCGPAEGKTTATISPAPVVVLPDLTVFATNQTKPYGQTMTLTEFTSIGLLGGQTIGAVTLTSAGTPATANIGPYAITASNARGGTFIPGNYTISYVNGVLTVVPAALTITASNVAKSYGQTPTLSGFTAAGLMNGDTVTSVTESSPGTVATAPVAGSPYVITPSAATGGTFTPGNYTISYVNGALAVTPAPLTVTASNVAKNYGDTPALTGFTTSALVNGETVGSVTETSPGSVATAPVAGTPYAITPSGATGGSFTPSNYTISYANGVLTVAPAPLTVTASNVAKSYGDTPALTGFTTSALVNGETVGSVTETSPGSAATAPVAGSPYVITPSGATGGTFTPSNYTIGYNNGVLTVTPSPLTVTASDVTKTFGQTPALTGFTTTPLKNGETVGSVTETSPGSVAMASAAGSPYAITPSDATGGTFTPSNYTIAYNDGVLTVRPAVVPPIENSPKVVPPVTPVTWVPVVTPPATPPELLTLVPPAPVVRPAPPAPAPAPVFVPTPIVTPVAPPPAVYLAPVHLRKQDRN
jgi:hypothetical protein